MPPKPSTTSSGCRPMAEKIRGIAVTYHTVHADKTALAHVSEAGDRRQFRRRLRSRRFHLRPRTQHRRHQHARRADRGGRRRRDGASDLHLARVRQGRPLSALGSLDHAELSAQRRIAARPQGRHRRHGPDRPGDRTPARRLARAGGVPFAQARGRRCLQALSRPDRDGEGGRYPDRHRPRAAPRPPR